MMNRTKNLIKSVLVADFLCSTSRYFNVCMETQRVHCL